VRSKSADITNSRDEGRPADELQLSQPWEASLPQPRGAAVATLEAGKRVWTSKDRSRELTRPITDLIFGVAQWRRA
jgi:hypothetical protein